MPKAHGKSVTPEQVLEDIQKVYDKLGHTPSFSEYRLHGGKYHRSTFRNRFGEYGGALKALGLTPRTNSFLPNQDFPIKLYDSFPKVYGDKIDLWFDLHVPYHDVELCREAADDAERRGVKTIILGGDFFDFKSIYKKEVQNIKINWTEELEVGVKVIAWLKQRFKIVFILGNHDWRLLRLIGSTEQGHLLLKMILEDKNVLVSEYKKCLVNDFLFVVHPDKTRKGKLSLVESKSLKYNKSVIMGHSHRFAFGVDDSGRNVVGEGLCMTMLNAHEYKGLGLDIHSEWLHGWWEVVGQSVRPHVKHKHILNGDKNDETQARLCNGKNRKDKNGVRNASCNC